MDTLHVTQIPSSVSRDTVDAAVALGGWFSRTYSMTTDAKEQVRLFRAARVELAKLPQIALTSVMQLISPSVVPHVNPAGTLKKIAAQWHYKAFAQNPYTLDDQVRAAQVDIIILALMGLLVYHKEQVQLAEYKVDSEGFVRAANRLMSWDSAVVLEDLRSWIPTAEADTVGGDHTVADNLCDGVKTLLSGGAVDVLALTAEVEQAGAGGPPAGNADDVAMTQLGVREPSAAAGVASGGVAGSANALTQDRAHGSDAADGAGRSQLKKMRPEPELGPSDFTEHRSIKAHILASALRSRQHLYTASKNRPLFKSMGTPVAVDVSMRACFRFLIVAGLAATPARSSSTSAMHLLSPGEDHIGAVLNALRGKLRLPDAAAENVRSAVAERDVSDSFDLDKFNRVIDFLGDSMPVEE